MKLDITDVLQLYYREEDLSTTFDKNDVYSNVESLLEAAEKENLKITYCCDIEFEDSKISKIIVYILNKYTHDAFFEDYSEHCLADEDEILNFVKDLDFVKIIKVYDDIKCSCDLSILMSVGCQCGVI